MFLPKTRKYLSRIRKTVPSYIICHRTHTGSDTDSYLIRNIQTGHLITCNECHIRSFGSNTPSQITDNSQSQNPGKFLSSDNGNNPHSSHHVVNADLLSAHSAVGPAWPGHPTSQANPAKPGCSIGSVTAQFQ